MQKFKENNNEIKYDMNIFSGNDMLGIFDLYKDWDGEYSPKDNDNIAYLSSYNGISKNIDSYDIVFFHRLEVYIEASRDTVDLIYEDKNGIDNTKGKNYDIDLEIDGFEAFGIGGNTKTQYNKNLSIYAGAYLLYGLNAQNGRMKGDVQITTDNQYIYEANIDYKYTDNLLYDLEIPKASGYGYTIDLGMEYDLEKFILGLSSQDILGRIYWDNIAYSDVVAKSSINDTKLFKNPSVSGTEKNISWTQEIEAKYLASLAYKLNDTDRLTISTVYFHKKFFNNISTSKKTAIGTFVIGYDQYFKTKTLRYHIPNDSFLIEIQTQKLNFKNSKALGITLNWQF